MTTNRSRIKVVRCRVGQARFERRPTREPAENIWWAGAAKRRLSHPTVSQTVEFVSCAFVAGCLTVLVSLSAGSVMADEAAFAEVPEAATIEFLPAKNEGAVPEHFRLQPHRFEAEAELLRERGSLRTLAVTFPSPVETIVPENNTVHAEYFQPAGPGPFPGVVVLHILGGEFPLSQTVASALARAQVAALFVKMPYYGERRSKESDRKSVV